MSTYIHGTDPKEQERLTLLNTLLLNDRCIAELSLHAGEKVLDVGSGLGQFTRLMAKTAGARAVGIERSPDQIAEAVRQAADASEEGMVEFREGDARSLPLRAEEWGTFDCVHARFVLEHVPDPITIVQQMVRAARPGGRIVLSDDDHDVMRLYPEVEGFSSLWQAYIRSYRVVNNDPDIGRKLVALLHETGATPYKNTWVFFGSCYGDKHFPAYVENLIGVIITARNTIVGHALMGEREFDETIHRLREWKERPGSALWYALAWAEGKKP